MLSEDEKQRKVIELDQKVEKRYKELNIMRAPRRN